MFQSGKGKESADRNLRWKSEETMMDGRGFAFGIFALGLGGFALYNGFRHFFEKQLIVNTPTSRIRSLAMGPVEIFGKVVKRNDSKVKTHITKKSCVWCRCTVEEYRSNGKSSSWHKIFEDTVLDEFYLEDKTGRVLIDPRNAEIEIPMRFEEESGLFGKFSERSKEFIASKRIRTLNKIRVREYYLLPGEETYIFGTAGRNPYVKTEEKVKNENNIMIQKGKKSAFFYISNCSENEVLKKYDLMIWLGFIGGPLSIIFGIWMIIMMLLA